MATRKERVEETLKLSYNPKTSLGKRLLEIRAKIFASGARPLDWEEIEQEVADRRGGLEGDAR